MQRTGEVGNGTQVAALALAVAGALIASLWLLLRPGTRRVAILVSIMLILEVAPNVLYAGGLEAALEGWPSDTWAGTVVLVVTFGSSPLALKPSG